MANFCRECGAALEQRLAFGKTRGVCPSCGYTHFDDPKLAVGVVVELDGGILLGRRNHDPMMGWWSFPSGFVDAGEVPEDAARREVEEETGIKVTLDRMLGVYSKAGERVIFIAYAGHAVGGKLEAGEECIEVATFDAAALPDMAFPNDGTILAAWRSGRGIPLGETRDVD
jgi:ADP-ribose pyrophosphatase YjhB (NUDIX family)